MKLICHGMYGIHRWISSVKAKIMSIVYENHAAGFPFFKTRLQLFGDRTLLIGTSSLLATFHFTIMSVQPIDNRDVQGELGEKRSAIVMEKMHVGVAEAQRGFLIKD